MRFDDVPAGFGMALTLDPIAMNAYSALPEEMRLKVLERARSIHSEEEMRRLVASITQEPAP